MSARYTGLVKHHGPFNDFILEEKEAWGDKDTPVMQITMPCCVFTDDEEVWMDIIPSDRNTGQKFTYIYYSGIYAYMLGQEDCLGLLSGRT